MSERHQVVPAVLVAVTSKANRVLLLRRAGTGYMDGRYDFPSGHMESGELPTTAAARELKEETSLEVVPEALRLCHVYVNENDPGLPYLGLVYKAMHNFCRGDFRIVEPNKCDDMGFYEIGRLPNVTPQVRDALGNISVEQVTHSYYGENEIGA
jgi:8-oxo-dGTP diphosphatase